MKYSKEYKLKCIEQYKRSEWPETPKGVKKNGFRNQVRTWVQLVEKHGEEALEEKKHYRKWNARERNEIVSKVISGAPLEATAREAGISNGLLHNWLKWYRIGGEKELTRRRDGTAPKEEPMKEQKLPTKKGTEEQEKIKQLEERVMYLEAENAYLKKLKALREKEAVDLKARKQLQ